MKPGLRAQGDRQAPAVHVPGVELQASAAVDGADANAAVRRRLPQGPTAEQDGDGVAFHGRVGHGDGGRSRRRCWTITEAGPSMSSRAGLVAAGREGVGGGQARPVWVTPAGAGCSPGHSGALTDRSAAGPRAAFGTNA